MAAGGSGNELSMVIHCCYYSYVVMASGGSRNEMSMSMASDGSRNELSMMTIY